MVRRVRAPTREQLDAGVSALRRWVPDSSMADRDARVVAMAVWLAMLGVPGKSGRPFKDPDDHREAVEELRAGVSVSAVRRKYGLGSSTVQRLKKEALGGGA